MYNKNILHFLSIFFKYFQSTFFTSVHFASVTHHGKKYKIMTFWTKFDQKDISCPKTGQMNITIKRIKLEIVKHQVSP